MSDWSDEDRDAVHDVLQQHFVKGDGVLTGWVLITEFHDAEGASLGIAYDATSPIWKVEGMAHYAIRERMFRAEAD